MFSQVLTATPLTLELIGGATAIALALAVACGCAAGAFPGRADTILSAVTGIFLAIPILPLAIIVAGVWPQGRHTAVATRVLMIGPGSWAAEARVLRAQAISRAAAATSSRPRRVIGESRTRIVLFEFIPNMAGRIAAGAFFIAIQAMVALRHSTFSHRSRAAASRSATPTARRGALSSRSPRCKKALLTGDVVVDLHVPGAALLATAAGLVLAMYGIEQAGRPDGSPLPPFAGPAGRCTSGCTAPRLRSPLPALRSFATALPYVGRHLVRRLPIYAVARSGSRSPSPGRAPAARVAREPSCPAADAARSGRATPIFCARSEPATSASVLQALRRRSRTRCRISLALVGTATLVAFAVGGLLGLIAAWRRGGSFDGPVTMGTALLWAVPTFAVAGLALEFLSVQWHPLPVQWSYDLDLEPAWTWRFFTSAFRSRRSSRWSCS